MKTAELRLVKISHLEWLSITVLYLLQFVVLALAAVALAEPEADPAYYYTNGVLTYKAHTPVVAPVAAPTVVKAGAYYNPLMYYNYYNPYVVPVVKTEAPAEPEAKAEEVVEAKTEEKVVAPVVYNYAPYHYAPYVAAPVAATYIKPASYVATSAPGVTHIVAKREAEAEADPAYYYAAGAYPYAYAGAYGAYPYRAYGAYAYPYAGYGYRYLF